MRAFRHSCLAKGQHALYRKTFRKLAVPCVQRLRASVQSAVRVRCLDCPPAGATRPRQHCARAPQDPTARLPRMWFTTTKTPAFVCLWHRRFAGRSKLGRVAAPLTVILEGKFRVTGLFCAIFLPNSIRRPSSDTHFIHPKHRSSIKGSRDGRVMPIAADYDAPKSTAWSVCRSSVQLLNEY